MTLALGETLARVADALAGARHPWWIIGSAAVALHGADVTVGDVDVLLGEEDARCSARRCSRGGRCRRCRWSSWRGSSFGRMMVGARQGR
jgi:hypothetical protein